jgi:hypothetical protein
MLIERLEAALVEQLDVVTSSSHDSSGPARYISSSGAHLTPLQLLLELCTAVIRHYLQQSSRPESVWLPSRVHRESGREFASSSSGSSLESGSRAGPQQLPLAMTKLPARVMRAASEAAELQVLTDVRAALQEATQGVLQAS